MRDDGMLRLELDAGFASRIFSTLFLEILAECIRVVVDCNEIFP